MIGEIKRGDEKPDKKQAPALLLFAFPSAVETNNDNV